MNLLTYIRVILFCFMLYGYFSFAIRRLKIEAYFAPVFVCSSIALIVYFSGLIGVLPYVTYGIGLLGFLLGCYSIYLKKKNGIELQNISVFQVSFICGTFGFMKLLLERHFIHYDNFTHWAMVVKEMLITNAFPATDTVMVTFTNYPLGASSFVYFVCRLTSNEQGIMLFAQGILVFACFYAVFAIIEQKRRFLLTIFLVMGLSFLSYFNLAVRIDNLLVDFLLATMTLATLSCVYCYREKLDKMFVVSTPMISLLLILKSTGVFYASMLYLYMCYICYKYWRNSTAHNAPCKIWGAKLLLSIGVAVTTWWTWSAYVNTMFANVEQKFDVSVSSVGGLYADRSVEQAQQIVSLFIRTLFDFQYRSSLGLLMFEVFGLAICIVGAIFFRGKWKSIKIYVGMNVVLIVYLVGILGMYVLAMPYEEACYLAGYDRYISSIVIVLLGVLCMNLTINLENSFYYKMGEVDDYKAFKSIETKKYYTNGIIICGLMTFFILSSEYNGIVFNDEWYPESIVGKVEAVVGDSWDAPDLDTKYLLYASDEGAQVSSYYLDHVGKYYLYAPNVWSISDCDDDILEKIAEHDYLIVVESDEEIKETMMNLFGQDGTEGVYKVKDLLSNK